MTRIATFEPRQWYDDIERLAQMNLGDVGVNLPCRLNRAAYDALHEAGMLACVGLFDGDTLAGYAVATVLPDMHHNRTIANHDGIFIHPAYRRPRLGLRLMVALEAECRARGAVAIAWHATPNTAFARLVCAWAKLEEFTFIKEL